jgi:hypothetical protein
MKSCETVEWRLPGQAVAAAFDGAESLCCSDVVRRRDTSHGQVRSVLGTSQEQQAQAGTHVHFVMVMAVTIV